MKNISKKVLLASLFFASSMAQATVYNFTYTFGTANYEPTSVKGSFEGDADGDIIRNLSNVSLTVNGFEVGPNPQIVGYTFDTPFASFSGTQNDFVFGVFVDNTYSGFGMTYAFDVGGPKAPPPYQLTVAYDPAGRWEAYETTVYAWNVEAASPAPEPQTYAMLLAGMGLIGAIARRRQRG